MRILFTSDLHGMIWLYDSLVDLSEQCGPDLIILGGDLLPRLDKHGNLLDAQRHFAITVFPSYCLKMHDINPDVHIGVILGNDDCQMVTRESEDLHRTGLIRLVDNSAWKTRHSWQVIGTSLVPETPFHLKDFERRDCEADPVRYPSVQAMYSSDQGIGILSSSAWF